MRSSSPRWVGTILAILAASGCSPGGTVSEGAGAGAGTTGSTGSSSGTLAGAGASTGTISGSSGTGTTGHSTASTSAVGAGSTGTTGPACTNFQCQVQSSCADGGHTVITGTVMDPAGADPLYNVVAYVPNSMVEALPKGVQDAGASCASCDALFSGEPMAVGLSNDQGIFSIPDAPVGTNIPLVIQVGKWRNHTTIPSVAACANNQMGSISLPSKMVASDPVINIPDIAVSTGSADSLECLLVRVGIDPSEYVAGNSTAGRVHIFNGGAPSGSGTTFGSGNGGGGGEGKQEKNLMSGAPDSDTSLWDSTADLAKYDLVLLSCEGGETYDAQPANLESYLNSGGRVFASHFHYAWFAGPLSSNQSYSAPTDWGNNLASWTAGSGGGTDADGEIMTTLWNGSPFPKGQALDSWLGLTGALGGSAPAGQLYIAAPKENATVSVSNTPSQPWITDSSTDSTLYFSFDTPIGGVQAPGMELGTSYCGRAVFSGLHVGGASLDGVNCTAGSHSGGGSGQGCNQGHVDAGPPPSGCDTHSPLSAQEKALEFMLFDLSSCVVPDTANPADAGIGPIFK